MMGEPAGHGHVTGGVLLLGEYFACWTPASSPREAVLFTSVWHRMLNGTSGRFTDRPEVLRRRAVQRRRCAAPCCGRGMRGRSSSAISPAPPPTFRIMEVRIAGAVLGIVIVAAVWANVAVTLLIPRGRGGYVKVVDRLVDRVYTAGGRLVLSWDWRDALLASQPVVTLDSVVHLARWLHGWLRAAAVAAGGQPPGGPSRGGFIAVHPRLRRPARRGAGGRR